MSVNTLKKGNLLCNLCGSEFLTFPRNKSSQELDFQYFNLLFSLEGMPFKIITFKII